MKDSGQENVQVSKLNISGCDSNQKMSTNRTCASLAVMKCRSCAEVFYAKHYENHWCFQREMDKLRESEIVKTREAGGKKNKEDKSVHPGKCPTPISNTTAPSEGHLIRDYRDLEAMLDIRPVVNKVWRSPNMLYKLFNKTGIAAPRECTTRDRPNFGVHPSYNPENGLGPGRIINKF